MNKITATKCIDGRRHRWKEVILSSYVMTTNHVYWCNKCGCITEFSHYFNEKKERCRDGKKYYIEIPKIWQPVEPIRKKKK